MRTTLDIDDDVLSAAKELAKAQDTTAGKVLSDLARKALVPPQSSEPVEYRNGFRLLPRTNRIITSEMVRRWLDEDV